MGMETVNPIVFNCNDLTLRRVHKVLGQSSAVPDVLKAMRDEKELYRKRRLKILPFTVEEYEKSDKTFLPISTQEVGSHDFLLHRHALFP